MANKDAKRRTGELEGTLKQRDRRIAELREEIDEQRDLINRLREHAEDYSNVLESWRDALEMTVTDDGNWTWRPFWDEHNALVDNYNNLVRLWNKYLPIISHRTQPVGRPLAASEAQVDSVRELHKDGMSLRDIMIETNLGFSTVRTIVGQIGHTDRTTKKHKARLERIQVDKALAAKQKRQRRTGATLPKRAQAIAEQGHALAKEARGLGRQK